MSTPNIQDVSFKCRVEYPATRRKCERHSKCIFHKTPSTGLEPWVLLDGSWKHWKCLKPKTISSMKSRIKNSREMDGFHDLLRADRIRIAQEMCWQLDEVGPNSTVKSSTLSIPEHLISNPSLKIQQDVPMSPIVLDRKISARNLSGAANDHSASLDKCHTSRIPPSFEPLVFLPETPLPSLDFRPRKSDKAQIPESTTTVVSNDISRYRENPLSIVGENFLFVDKNERWEVSEISFGKEGWEGVSILSERKSHRIDFEVLLSMLKHGVLDVIQEKGA